MQDIQRQWTPPVRREMLEDTMSRAHPEEHLRDCDMPYAWAQLRTASQATFQLKKAIREKWVSSSALSGGTDTDRQTDRQTEQSMLHKTERGTVNTI